MLSFHSSCFLCLYFFCGYTLNGDGAVKKKGTSLSQAIDPNHLQDPGVFFLGDRVSSYYYIIFCLFINL